MRLLFLTLTLTNLSLIPEVICSSQRDPHLYSWGVYWYDQKRLGDSAYYRCRNGYQSTSRNNQATCTRDGWTPKPLCRATAVHFPEGCGIPPTLADGDTKETVQIQYRHNEKVEYLCQNLYQMEGGPFRTCKNGEWIGQMRCLKPCTVDEDVMGIHNIRFKFSNEKKLYVPHNDVIDFSCIYGTRRVDRVGMRQTCIDGVMNFPTCV
uniref:Sushi domain-containing protein n=1 Tax=Amphiprion ocellaris TaxID=80972 RepID=A0A3Q1CGA4_AMPOC